MKHYIFEKTHDMDPESFANLLHLAKGNRSAREFALVCGVHPSTFTRIKNQLNRKASSPELLKAIAENAAPGSDVTLEKLANANGYTVNDSLDAGAKKEVDGVLAIVLPGIPSLSHYSSADHMIFSVICQELIARDKEITVMTKKYSIGKNIIYRPDALLRIRASNKDDETKEELWCMEFVNEYFIYERISARIFELISRFSFIGNDEAPDPYKPTHFALVITDQQAYNEIVDDFGDHMFSYDLRLILVGARDNHIENEFIFPFIDKKERNYLFKTPNQEEN